MKNTSRYLLSRIFLLIVMSGVFLLNSIFAQGSEAPMCPFPYKVKATSDEILAKVNECIAARANNTTKTITDFSCPAGDFILADGRPLTADLLSSNIAVNIIMNEVDTSMREYMQKLQSVRSKDAVAWSQEYSSCIGPTANKSTLVSFYGELCSPLFISNLLNKNTSGNPVIATTDGYPQRLCNDIAQKKIDMWTKVGQSLAVVGMHKSYENDRDRFIE